MDVHRLRLSEREAWARLRAALWPDCPPEEHQQEMEAILQNPEQEAVFVSAGPQGRLQGFVEVSIKPYAIRCETQPVGYLEGWYVEPEMRKKGVGKALVVAVEKWARSRGCREMASDTQVENEGSQRAHARLGYAEVERLVHFKKDLAFEE